MGEDTLIKSNIFSLPGRKALVRSDVEYEIILIDATESPCQRPKKTAGLLLWKEEKTQHQKPSCRR